jgi:hypothetical protein
LLEVSSLMVARGGIEPPTYGFQCGVKNERCH